MWESGVDFKNFPYFAFASGFVRFSSYIYTFLGLDIWYTYYFTTSSGGI